jgi:hypothetical protein
MIEPKYYALGRKMRDSGYRTIDIVGYTPEFLSEDSEDDAVKQLDEHYSHGGGWRDFEGFTFVDGDEPKLTYPGDPPTNAIAHWKLRDERIILFEHAWVAVVQPDGKFRVARMD